MSIIFKGHAKHTIVVMCNILLSIESMIRKNFVPWEKTNENDYTLNFKMKSTKKLLHRSNEDGQLKL